MTLGWILGNLFLLSIIMVGAGTFWLLGVILVAAGFPADDNHALWTLAAIAAICVAYYFGRSLLRFIQKSSSSR